MTVTTFGPSEYRDLVQDITGEDDVDDFLVQWFSRSRQLLCIENLQLVHKVFIDIDMGNTRDFVYFANAVNNWETAFDIATVVLLDQDDNEYEELTKTSLEQIWKWEHRQHVDAEQRQPTHWAMAGIRLDNYDNQLTFDGVPVFRVFPQPTTGLYTTWKVRVWVHTIFNEIATVGDPSSTSFETFRTAMFERIARFAYLYVRDRVGYRIARSRYRKAIRKLKSTHRLSPSERIVYGGG